MVLCGNYAAGVWLGGILLLPLQPLRILPHSMLVARTTISVVELDMMRHRLSTLTAPKLLLSTTVLPDNQGRSVCNALLQTLWTVPWASATFAKAVTDNFPGLWGHGT